MTRRVPAGGQVLDDRRLNRATLARQHLLERVRRPAFDEIAHLVGMQAQVPGDPFVGLWARLESFDPEELSALVRGRDVVRLGVLRTTLHLVTADDALSLRAFTQPVLERTFWKGSPFSRHVAGLDVDELLADARDFLAQTPASTRALAAHLGSRWSDRDANALAYTVRYLEPIVQVPPRGTWGASHQATWTTVEAWLGRTVPRTTDEQALVLRYLASFGPASIQDMQTWSWRTRLSAWFDALWPQLVTFRSERGVELFDLPDAPRPPADTPAPVRFLPEFDNLLLSHKDRRRFLASELAYDRLWHGNVLVDGMLRGTWRFRREPATSTLEVQLLAEPTPSDGDAVESEARALLAFLTEGKGGALDLAVRSERD